VRPLDRFGLPTDAVLRWTLLAGVLLRVVIFKPLWPVNNDDHLGVVTYFFHLRRPAALRWMNGALAASYVVFGAYFIVEVASAVMAS
jgi:hypothetical protein